MSNSEISTQIDLLANYCRRFCTTKISSFRSIESRKVSLIYLILLFDLLLIIIIMPMNIVAIVKQQLPQTFFI